VSLRAEHPEAEHVRGMLRTLDLGLTVLDGLVATLAWQVEEGPLHGAAPRGRSRPQPDLWHWHPISRVARSLVWQRGLREHVQIQN